MFGRAKKPTALEIGQNGTPEELRAANTKALTDRDHSYYYGDRAQRDLQQGAIEAFKEGRPENLQLILANPDEFEIRSEYSRRERVNSEKIIEDLSRDAADPVATILLAIGGVPASRQTATLNSLLNRAISSHTGGEAFYKRLITAGAEANATIGGHAGMPLVTATCNKSPLSVIQLLHDNGASFDDALASMHSRANEMADIERLKFYHEKITGTSGKASLSTAPEVLDVVRQLQEQMRELTERVGELTEEMRAANTKPARAPRTKPTSKPPYPKAF